MKIEKLINKNTNKIIGGDPEKIIELIKKRDRSFDVVFDFYCALLIAFQDIKISKSNLESTPHKTAEIKFKPTILISNNPDLRKKLKNNEHYFEKNEIIPFYVEDISDEIDKMEIKNEMILNFLIKYIN